MDQHFVTPPWLQDFEEPAPGLPMTGERFKWCLRAIGWSPQELATRVHTHESSIRQMRRGKRDIPDALAIWVEDMAALILAAPHEPPGWRPKPNSRERIPESKITM